MNTPSRKESSATDCDHHYEELKPQRCAADGGYLTPISRNETQPKYVPSDGIKNIKENPPTKQDNNTHEHDQTQSLLHNEATYSNQSQTYLKSPVERSPNCPNENHQNVLPDALPSTTHNNEHISGNKSYCCKFSKRNLFTAVSLCLNFILGFGLVFTLFKLRGRPTDCVTTNPEVLRVQKSVCLRCDSDKFNDLRFFMLYTQDCQKFCCVDNAEHLQWLIKMAEVRIISDRAENNKARSHHVYNVFAEGKSQASNENTVSGLKMQSKTIRKSPAEYNFQVPEQGVYLIYLFLTAQLNSSYDQFTDVVAMITSKSTKGREFVLARESHTLVGKCRYPISLFRISWLSKGDSVSFSFSHPSFLYGWDIINFSGIVSL